MKNSDERKHKENPGPGNEKLVEEAFKLLIAENKLFVDYIRCNESNLFESKKIDAIAVTRSSLAFLIQIKSTKTGALGHYEGRKNGDGSFEKKPCHHILAIWPLENETAEELSRRLLKIAYEIIKNPATSAYELHLKHQNWPLFI